MNTRSPTATPSRRLPRAGALLGALLLGAVGLTSLSPSAAQTAPQTTPAQPSADQNQTAPTPAGAGPSAPVPTTEPPATSGPATDPATVHEQAGRCVEGSEQACLALTRQGKDGKERRILVVRTGTSDDTGIYTICGPQDKDPEGTPNIGVFSETGAGGIRVTIDKNVIRVPLAIVTQKPAPDGQDGSDGRVEASAGTARYLDTPPPGATDRLLLCGVEAKPQPAPDTVLVTQGKTRLKGQKLVYDETDGIARIDGPITFNRDNDKDPLSGKSDRIEVNVDEEKTLLVGNVVLQSAGGRVSRAGRVEYDDTHNQARLYATPEAPAESVKGSDVLRVTSGSILYHLDTNDVYVVKDGSGNISGEFQDGESAAPATPPATRP